MNTVALTLDTVFQETIWHNEIQFNHYEQLYTLPRLQYIQHTCSQTLSYIQKKNGFVIVLLYSQDGKVFVTYDWSSRGLPAASIKNKEDVHDTIARISKRIHVDVEIRDVQPLCFVDNTFCHKDIAHTLHGIVFTARVHNTDVIEDIQHGWLFPLHDDFIDWVHKYGNKDILTYFKNNILKNIMYQQKVDTQEDEIETNEKMKYRYLIHRKWWKPILKLLWLNKNNIIKKWIINQCQDGKKIIDVSCGDDDIIHQLQQHNDLVVANDISRSQVQLLKAKNHNVVCTNHNASDLPFKDRIFDIALCKNTLHHMPHRAHLMWMLTSMKRIAKKIIIVEIENPNHTWWFAKRLHHKRYRGFLKDVWWAYFDNKQFSSLLYHVFWQTHNIEEWTFETPQWRYFWSVITA